MDYKHCPVLLKEALEILDLKPEGKYIDGTAGGGGHSEAILRRLSSGVLLSIDQDPDAINTLKERLRPYKASSIIRQSNFSKIREVAEELGLKEVDGILLDIGVSSYQLDCAERGFSYHEDGPLDMRMGNKGSTAEELVNGLSESELSKILFTFGEERYARRIAREIIVARTEQRITRTVELAELIKRAYPAAERRRSHPARKSFQALRIAVNHELECLSEGLDAAFSLLKEGGILAVITFHSLEDRMVKQRMASWERGCKCPPDFPICICGGRSMAKVLTKKPVVASENEREENQRSRSAKLRACMCLKRKD